MNLMLLLVHLNTFYTISMLHPCSSGPSIWKIYFSKSPLHFSYENGSETGNNRTPAKIRVAVTSAGVRELLRVQQEHRGWQLLGMLVENFISDGISSPGNVPHGAGRRFSCSRGQRNEVGVKKVCYTSRARKLSRFNIKPMGDSLAVISLAFQHLFLHSMPETWS